VKDRDFYNFIGTAIGAVLDDLFELRDNEEEDHVADVRVTG
jgi:hypothetical protein